MQILEMSAEKLVRCSSQLVKRIDFPFSFPFFQYYEVVPA